MKVILKKDLKKLGEEGEVVSIADGYGRNFLIPKGLAVEATSKNIGIIEHEKKLASGKLSKERKDFEKLAAQIEGVSCTIIQAVGENDRLFGSVTALNIAESLKKEGIEIDKRKILLDEPIKSLGIYDIPIKLHPEVTAKLKLWVVKE